MQTVGKNASEGSFTQRATIQLMLWVDSVMRGSERERETVKQISAAERGKEGASCEQPLDIGGSP